METESVYRLNVGECRPSSPVALKKWCECDKCGHKVQVLVHRGYGFLSVHYHEGKLCKGSGQGVMI